MEMHEKPQQRLILLPEIDNSSTSLPQDANDIEDAIPPQKVKDLQAVVNAVDHYVWKCVLFISMGIMMFFA